MIRYQYFLLIWLDRTLYLTPRFLLTEVYPVTSVTHKN
ncbi:hypothetical protein [Aeromonas phage Akh-2]|nr:hypothetical protein [Aeromonas phage Akh-2]